MPHFNLSFYFAQCGHTILDFHNETVIMKITFENITLYNFSTADFWNHIHILVNFS